MSLYTDVEAIRDKVKKVKTKAFQGTSDPFGRLVMLQVGTLFSELQDSLDEVLDKHKDTK